MIIIVITRVEDWAVSQNVVNFLHPSSQSLVRNKVGLQFGQTLYIYLGLGSGVLSTLLEFLSTFIARKEPLKVPERRYWKKIAMKNKTIMYEKCLSIFLIRLYTIWPDQQSWL